MTGIERLRRLASDMRDSGWRRMHDDLAEIADKIEREYGRSAETVRADAMEAWRWVRKRGGLATLQLHEETFADMMRQRDEYRAIARDYERDATWVREHGGLERVKWLLDWCLSHDSKIEQLDFDYWLSGRVMHELGFEGDMADRDEVERRLLASLMPRVGWPRYEDGEMVLVGSDIADELGETHTVTSIEFLEDETLLHWNPDEPEECVWVGRGERVRRPAHLTHERPVSDTWERLEEDARELKDDIGFHLGDYSPSDFKKLGDSIQDRVMALVRRAKALAGVSE